MNGDDEASATFSAMAAVKIPVFHWGEGKNKVRSARMEEEISRLNLEKTTDLMRLQITSARFSVTDAQKRVEMARNALSQAKENLKISNDQYQVGMENLTALLEAQAPVARNLEPVDRCESLVTPECIPIPESDWKVGLKINSKTTYENFDLIFLFEFIIFVLLIINFIK